MDEMDLLSGMKTAEPMRPQAFEEARAMLRTAMTVEGAHEVKSVPQRRAFWSRRRTAGFGVVAVGAAAAAVALVVTSTSAPSAPVTHNPAAAGQPATAGQPSAANPVLARLAANVTAMPAKLPGNATLEIRNQSPTSAQPGANGYDVYTDDGTYFWGFSKSNLEQTIAQGQDVGQGAFKRAIAAALIATKGDVSTGRANMAIANYIPGTKPGAGAKQAEIDKLKAVDKEKHIKYTPPKPLTPLQQKEQTDSFIWMNSVYALTAAPENPSVRAGVLDIMATMPNVKVTHTTTAGQPTLTLADSWPDLSGGDAETLVINASTGVPIAESDQGSGDPLTVTYFHASRVTLANVEAGKF
ncbi:MAG: hypothetical protein ACRDN0_04565 [Trebonia sp.]